MAAYKGHTAAALALIAADPSVEHLRMQVNTFKWCIMIYIITVNKILLSI